MKYLVFILIFISSYCSGQNYLIMDAGKNYFGGSFIEKTRSIYWGFGVSFFTNEYRKGNKYFDGRPSDIYRTALFNDGKLFGLVGTEFHKFMVELKFGVGSKKWYNNGITNDITWYSFRDGGNYFVYGLGVRRQISPLIVGLGYDNFSGLCFSAGVSLNKVRQ